MKIATFSLLASCVVFVMAASPNAHSNPYPNTGVVSPVTVPYYGASYGPAAGFTSADAKRVIELLEGIQTKLDSIDSKLGAGQGPVAQKKLDPLTVAKGACIGCHTPGKAEKVGGDFILFSDDKGTAFKPLNTKDKVRIQQKVLDSSMPPNKELKADEKAAFRW